MIKSIYFYDGPVYMAAGKLNVKKDAKFTTIYAGMGTTYNLEQVRFYSASADINILTNNPQLLSFDLCDEFFLFDFKNNEFRSIYELTEKELHKTHDLRKLWIGGTFPETKMIFEKPLS